MLLQTSVALLPLGARRWAGQRHYYSIRGIIIALYALRVAMSLDAQCLTTTTPTNITCRCVWWCPVTSPLITYNQKHAQPRRSSGKLVIQFKRETTQGLSCSSTRHQDLSLSTLLRKEHKGFELFFHLLLFSNKPLTWTRVILVQYMLFATVFLFFLLLL